MLFPMATLLNKISPWLNCASLSALLHSLIFCVVWSVGLSIAIAPRPFCLSVTFTVFYSHHLLFFHFLSSYLSCVSPCPSTCLDIVPPHPSTFCLSYAISFLSLFDFLSLLSSHPLYSLESRQTYWELAAVSNGDILQQCYWVSKDISSSFRKQQILLMALSNCSHF